MHCPRFHIERYYGQGIKLSFRWYVLSITRFYEKQRHISRLNRYLQIIFSILHRLVRGSFVKERCACDLNSLLVLHCPIKIAVTNTPSNTVYKDKMVVVLLNFLVISVVYRWHQFIWYFFLYFFQTTYTNKGPKVSYFILQ